MKTSLNLNSVKINVAISSLTNEGIKGILQKVNKEKEYLNSMLTYFIKADVATPNDHVWEKAITECNKDIKILEKMQRKVNGYKKIIVEHDNDYDRLETVVTFPKGTKKSFKMKWLENNDYPLSNEHFHIDSMYDCTGKVCSIRVEHKGNKYTVVRHLDL